MIHGTEDQPGGAGHIEPSAHRDLVRLEPTPVSEATAAARKVPSGGVGTAIKLVVFVTSLVRETWRMRDSARAESLMRTRPWWALLPLGLGSWWLVYAGVYARRKTWTALGLPWLLLTIVGWIPSFVSPKGHHGGAGSLILLGWVGTAITAFTVRRRYLRRITTALPAPAIDGNRSGDEP
jgi:hypothetical protein